jgi:hypothetical protein
VDARLPSARTGRMILGTREHRRAQDGGAMAKTGLSANDHHLISVSCSVEQKCQESCEVEMTSTAPSPDWTHSGYSSFCLLFEK